MASYAPLFAHVDGWQWKPDMIWVDNMQTIGTPNYYVQQLFSLNKGTHVVPLLENGKALAGQDSLYASSAIDKNTNELIVKLVNVSGKIQKGEIQVEGIKKLNENATLIVLADELEELNSISEPTNVKPIEQKLRLKGKKISLPLAPYSFTILRVKIS
jgi:alpha-L-arabinofuranosidase